MIAAILFVRETPERVEVGFHDSKGRSWMVYWSLNASTQEISRGLMAMACIATEPERAVYMGLITMEDLEAAEAAVAKNLLIKSTTPTRSM